jgi:predicted phage tail protein
MESAMRTWVHFVLLLCGIAVGIGAFLPIMQGTNPTNVAIDDLRNGFPAGWALEQIGDQSVTFYKSMAMLLVIAAVLILLSALVGSRILGWLGVIVGAITLGASFFRVDERFGDQFRDQASNLLSNQMGLNLLVGGLVVALLACLVPREKTATTAD